MEGGSTYFYIFSVQLILMVSVNVIISKIFNFLVIKISKEKIQKRKISYHINCLQTIKQYEAHIQTEKVHDNNDNDNDNDKEKQLYNKLV